MTYLFSRKVKKKKKKQQQTFRLMLHILFKNMSAKEIFQTE